MAKSVARTRECDQDYALLKEGNAKDGLGKPDFKPIVRASDLKRMADDSGQLIGEVESHHGGGGPAKRAKNGKIPGDRQIQRSATKLNSSSDESTLSPFNSQQGELSRLLAILNAIS